MGCAVLAIGDEITTGKVVDTNSAWISDRLLEIGVPTVLHLSVPDELDAIIEAFRLCGERARHVIVTGGLGPTEDDLTREAFAKFANVGMVENPEALDQIKNIFRIIGRLMTDNNKKQAFIPQGSELIKNNLGTAPGFMMSVDNATYYFLPGVPRECEAMIEQTVLPRLAAGSSGIVFRHKLFRTFGMTESQLDQELSNLGLPEGVKLGFRAVFPEIHLKLIAERANEKDALAALAKAEELLLKKVGAVVYSDDGRSLEEVVLDLMREKRMRLAVAESCTGGMIAKRLIDVPGSSDVLDRGYVSYSNPSKIDMLGVDPEIIEQYGAVSSECARAMATGARERAKVDLALAVTGIAGPTGGTVEKPIGTVHIAVADEKGVWENQFLFARADRTFVRELTAQAALEIVRRRVLGMEEYQR